MTIALGFHCTDGLVIATDTEETAGDSKSKVQKIMPVQCNWGTFTFAGAGSGELIDASVQGMYRDIMDRFEPLESFEAVIDLIRKHLQSAFETNIAPYASFSREDRPSLQLIIGIQFHGGMRLIKATPPNIIADCMLHDIIGMGVLGGKALLQRLHTTFLNMEGSAVMAAYILKHVKSSILYCGNDSSVVLQGSDGSLKVIATPYLRALENKFDEVDERMKESLLSFIESETKTPLAVEYENHRSK